MEPGIKAQMQDFLARLNKEPNKEELGKTPDDNAKTLPISFVEMTLDELFLGQWELSEPTYQQIFNEVVGTAILTVWHPVTERPIRRAGFASVVITQDANAKLVDFNTTKKKNALDLTFPKLKAEILKNAASSLGKVFGRDINRKVFDQFKPAYTKLSDEGFNALLKKIEAGDTIALEQAKSYFILTDLQQDILNGLKQQKQIA